MTEERILDINSSTNILRLTKKHVNLCFNLKAIYDPPVFSLTEDRLQYIIEPYVDFDYADIF